MNQTTVKAFGKFMPERFNHVCQATVPAGFRIWVPNPVKTSLLKEVVIDGFTKDEAIENARSFCREHYGQGTLNIQWHSN